MTEELFIEFEGTINLYSLRKADNATDGTTDLSVSMKLIDDDVNRSYAYRSVNSRFL